MINSYATLADFKANATARGQTPTSDTTDDEVIKGLLESASRYLDGMTGREFYPRLQTLYYSIPGWGEIWLDADVLEVVTFLNGDTTSIASSNYDLLPINQSVKYLLKLKGSSSVTWQTNAGGDSENVLTMTAFTGYHERYSNAWGNGGTLGAAIATDSILTLTMTAGHTLVAGQIIKIDSELFNIDSISTNTVTVVSRGDNGSTAATHLNGATVYYWIPDARANAAVIDQATIDYDNRFNAQKQTASKTATEFKLEGIASAMRLFSDQVQRLI